MGLGLHLVGFGARFRHYLGNCSAVLSSTFKRSHLNTMGRRQVATIFRDSVMMHSKSQSAQFYSFEMLCTSQLSCRQDNVYLNDRSNLNHQHTSNDLRQLTGRSSLALSNSSGSNTSNDHDTFELAWPEKDIDNVDCVEIFLDSYAMVHIKCRRHVTQAFAQNIWSSLR